ncbi:hypothetical protein CFK37_17595 [Virgibacillus phasianinus]|uniref:CXXC-20-CXXC protein n=1 Tax=Virgibacillus phasianinus TaxID=2017483 RepID=A0A220U794_9BACI|nr:hypothetical protein CFK37_17595 [Virgibacillus phasianinus]
MPTCQHCGSIWSWKDTFLQVIKFKMKMKCPNCEEIQYQSAKSRKRSQLYFLPIIFFIVFLNLANVTLTIYISTVVFVTILILLFTPYTIELSNEEEPLW